MISAQKISSAVTVVALLQLCAVQRTEATGSKNGWVVTTMEGTLKILSVDLAEVRKLECRCPKVPKLKGKNLIKFLEKNIGEIKQDAMNSYFLYLEDGESPHEVLKGKMKDFNTHYKNIKPNIWEKMGNLIWADLENHKAGRDADTFENIETPKDFEEAVNEFDKRYPNGPGTPRVDSEEEPKKPRTKRQLSMPCAIIPEIEPSWSSQLNIDFDELTMSELIEKSNSVSEVSTADEKSVTRSKSSNEYSETVTELQSENSVTRSKSSNEYSETVTELQSENSVTISKSSNEDPVSVTELESTNENSVTRSKLLSSDEDSEIVTEPESNIARRRLAMARLVAAECSQF